MLNNSLMTPKERYLGLRLTGELSEALERFCRKEDRSLSSAVRYLVTAELQRRGYLKEEEEPKKKGKST